MKRIDRRTFLGAGAGLAAWSMLPGLGMAQQGSGLRQVRLGVGLKAMSPIVINLVIGEILGYNAAEGFTLNTLALGTNANVQVAVDRGEVDFGVGVPSFGLPVLAQGDWKLARNFYQYTYPYKWDIAVLPDSPVQSYADLKGLRIGVSDFGATDYPVTRNVLRLQGLDPDSDLQWIAVGNGVPAGVALRRQAVDALAYFDTGFGQIEAAGLPFRLLPRPDNLPLVGGQFLQTRVSTLDSHPQWAVGLGRSVSKASTFILENPRAGALAFLRMYPETAPRGASQDAAVEAVLQAISRRIKLYRPPYPDVSMGYIEVSEFRTEAEMTGLQIADYAPFYTNDLIGQIDDYDHEAIRTQARNYT